MSPRTGGEETRARLRSAAARCFSRHGYAATKVSDVVKEARLTQAAFYLYFPSKEAVYAELLGSFSEGLLSHIRSWQPDPELPAALIPFKLHANLTELLEFLRDQGEHTRLVLQDPEAGQEIREQLAGAVCQVLELIRPAGFLRPELDLEVTSQALLGMLERLTHRYLLTEQKTPEQIVDSIFVLLLRGLHQLPEV